MFFANLTGTQRGLGVVDKIPMSWQSHAWSIIGACAKDRYRGLESTNPKGLWIPALCFYIPERMLHPYRHRIVVPEAMFWRRLCATTHVVHLVRGEDCAHLRCRGGLLSTILGWWATACCFFNSIDPGSASFTTCRPTGGLA